ncbi:MAG: 16S rRNA (cytidine(1402)-2'-O)-methyltransferase [Desulfovibrio sp.]|nr:16S rRNA (cytidine(1402)-2'-O)-methyltransferase [Desulfovibrio sp.]
MPSPANRLWIVATPIGNPGDFSPRARRILSEVDLVLAEDTRRTARLLRQCSITVRRLLSFHDHNEEERQEHVLKMLRTGSNIALVSDAGTPLMADPGYRLVRSCRAEGLSVSPLPGPSAPVTALSAAGIAPLPYTFLGFLPRDNAGRDALFQIFASVPGTLVFFERKDRLKESLRHAASILGQRDLAICRELTKEHEEFILTRLEAYAELPDDFLGELTVIIGPSEQPIRTPDAQVYLYLKEVMKNAEKPRQIVRQVQEHINGWTGKEIYALLHELPQIDTGQGENASKE